MSLWPPKVVDTTVIYVFRTSGTYAGRVGGLDIAGVAKFQYSILHRSIFKNEKGASIGARGRDSEREVNAIVSSERR